MCSRQTLYVMPSHYRVLIFYSSGAAFGSSSCANILVLVEGPLEEAGGTLFISIVANMFRLPRVSILEITLIFEFV